MPKTNTAFLVDLATGKCEAVEIGGYRDITHHLRGDASGETLRQLTEDTFLRKWTAVDPDPARKVAVFDAYVVPSLRSVDVPAEAKVGLEIGI